jgi:hypothetical protein
MPKYCSDCGLANFRLSRFRKKDIWKLFKLEYPIRCRECLLRSYGSLFRLSEYSSKPRKKVEPGVNQ